jgi:hypothetical protein
MNNGKNHQLEKNQADEKKNNGPFAHCGNRTISLIFFGFIKMLFGKNQADSKICENQLDFQLPERYLSCVD